MPGHSLSLLSDQELRRDLAVLVARDRTTTAALLAHLAEVDARRLYLPAAYPSMYLYCVYELGLSEDRGQRLGMNVLVRLARHRNNAGFLVVAEVPMAPSLPDQPPAVEAEQLQHLPDLHQ